MWKSYAFISLKETEKNEFNLQWVMECQVIGKWIMGIDAAVFAPVLMKYL